MTESSALYGEGRDIENVKADAEVVATTTSTSNTARTPGDHPEER